MLLDNFQIQQTLKRYKERSKERERNERFIKEKRFLAIDSPERVDGTLFSSNSLAFESHIFFSGTRRLYCAFVVVHRNSPNDRSLTEFGDNLLSEE